MNNTCMFCDSPFESAKQSDRECPSCRDSERQRRSDDRKAENMAKTLRMCQECNPPAFALTSTDHPSFNRAAWARIKDWIPTRDRPWLGLIGRPGGSKTRIARLIAVSETIRIVTDSRKPTLEIISAYELSAKILASTMPDYSTDEKRAAREALQRFRVADTLMIDDIGKGRMTQGVAAEMFAIIDYRAENIIPTIWTSNFTPERIGASMSDDFGAALAGRINDFSRIFDCDA